MSFVKKIWKDRISQFPNRRTINDGYVTKQVTVGRDEGTVTEEGTPFDATEMNDLENRIYAAIEQGGGGGGGAGTYDYTELFNKPRINNHELNGNKSLGDLGIASNANELPIESGSATSTKAYIDNTKPQIYVRNDVLLNSAGGTVRGFGAAMITMQNGIARIDFNLKITVAENVQNIFTWGINRDYFTALTGKSISPQAGGSCVYYDANNVIYESRTDLGGIFSVNGQFWQPARVYNDNGTYKIGGWASIAFQQNSRIVGTCYGTYT